MTKSAPILTSESQNLRVVWAFCKIHEVQSPNQQWYPHFSSPTVRQASSLREVALHHISNPPHVQKNRTKKKSQFLSKTHSNK